MEREKRAYVAYMAGSLISGYGRSEIFDLDRGLALDMKGQNHPQKTRSVEQGRTCGTRRDPDGSNYCLIDCQGRRHICLTLYGKLFEGYDHSTASHFNGFVTDNTVALYDFKASDFYNYRV